MPGTRDSASRRAKTPATASAPTAIHAQPRISPESARVALASRKGTAGDDDECARPLIGQLAGRG